MAADRGDVAVVEAALGSAKSSAGDGSKAGVGEAVSLPSVPVLVVSLVAAVSMLANLTRCRLVRL